MVTREEAEQAVRVLLRWAGEDPAREGLLDTPRRVTEAFGDLAKFAQLPEATLKALAAASPKDLATFARALPKDVAEATKAIDLARQTPGVSEVKSTLQVNP